MAPAFGNADYSVFDGGDSILKATNLLAAIVEATAKYGRAVTAYNADNPTVAIPLPDSNIDPETSTRTMTFSLLASKVYDATANAFVNEFKNYIQPYSGWTVPTTGNLAGVTSLGEALFLILQAVKLGNDLITPNLLFADPSQYTTVTDNQDGAIECSCTMVVNESFDAVTGNPTFTAWDYFQLLNDQQGL